MRWFKHMTDASDNEFIERLEADFGLEGYARWWKLCEIIGKHMDNSGRCHAEYSWTKWQSFLKGKRNKLETFLKRLENESKIKIEEKGNILKIELHNILKYKDEYSKKSGQPPEKNPDTLQTPIYREQNTDIEVEERGILTDTTKESSQVELSLPALMPPKRKRSVKLPEDFDFGYCIEVWNREVGGSNVAGAICGTKADAKREAGLRELMVFLEKHYRIPWREGWITFVRGIVATPSMTSGNNKSGWIASFDYAVNPKNTAIILEKTNESRSFIPQSASQNNPVNHKTPTQIRLEKIAQRYGVAGQDQLDGASLLGQFRPQADSENARRIYPASEGDVESEIIDLQATYGGREG